MDFVNNHNYEYLLLFLTVLPIVLSLLFISTDNFRKTLMENDENGSIEGKFPITPFILLTYLLVFLTAVSSTQSSMLKTKIDLKSKETERNC